MKFFKRKSSAKAPANADQVESSNLPVASEDQSVAPVAALVEPEIAVEVAVEPLKDAEVAISEKPRQDAPVPAVLEAEVLQGSDKSTTQQSGLFSRLKRGLSRTSEGMGSLLLGAKEIDSDLFEELETRLLMADVGVEATVDIIESLTRRVSRRELTRPEALQGALKEELLALLEPCQKPLNVTSNKPFVILVVGVNGVGKTTTIGKLAKRFGQEGREVMLAAGDTFRAAAVEQLQVWGERNAVPVVAQHTGADSASVIYDSVQAAKARGIDVLIADTAGRLHNKDNLMDELEKVVRVMGKLDSSAPHEVLLVLDAGTGQNALAQASHFQKVVGVTGLCLTKLDGTAKGGVIFAIAKKLNLPIRYIGVGEAVDDLRPFDAKQFIDALFSEASAAG
jgi:fused signal recognition particle receptor